MTPVVVFVTFRGGSLEIIEVFAWRPCSPLQRGHACARSPPTPPKPPSKWSQLLSTRPHEVKASASLADRSSQALRSRGRSQSTCSSSSTRTQRWGRPQSPDSSNPSSRRSCPPWRREPRGGRAGRGCGAVGGHAADHIARIDVLHFHGKRGRRSETDLLLDKGADILKTHVARSIVLPTLGLEQMLPGAFGDDDQRMAARSNLRSSAARNLSPFQREGHLGTRTKFASWLASAAPAAMKPASRPISLTRPTPFGCPDASTCAHEAPRLPSRGRSRSQRSARRGMSLSIVLGMPTIEFGTPRFSISW